LAADTSADAVSTLEVLVSCKPDDARRLMPRQAAYVTISPRSLIVQSVGCLFIIQ
jgi:hypothetical protein